MNFKTQWNAEAFLPKKEVNHQPSCTIPDQTMSIKTIMERYARGIPVDSKQYVPMYHEDGQAVIMPERMDLIERAEYLKSIQAKIDELEAEKREQAKLKAEQEAEAAFLAEAKKRGLVPGAPPSGA